ncbi:CaiB/BaiF CoA transferase family protein [Nonomuraea fuscirosea]|uniref:CaiB/BaiF CoA transferase family protein n=1 Tax=Nonomuraea fuscirosea TaxID=1291556 RepID=UPI0034084DFF
MNLLAGITVVDFSRVLAGPMATQILAELGADVIKIERPGAGDESRGMQPLLPNGESAYFFAFNRGKRSVTLNLKTEQGRETARRLVAKADVLVENFLPGTMDRLGLGYRRLAAENPGLVYVSCTGFGQTGPNAHLRGYDTIFQALSGITSTTGHPDGPPAKAGVPVADMTTALWIALAALAGLLRRGTTGKGGQVDLAMMDVQITLLALAAARLFALDEDVTRTGTAHPGRVPSEAYQCADGTWLQISCSDQHWPVLCSALGLQELASDNALATNAGRVAQRDRVTEALSTAFAKSDRAELAAALRTAGVPAGEVHTVREALADEHTVARGVVGHFDHPVEGRFPALRTPLRLDEPDGQGFSAAPIGIPPLLGADTTAVLIEKLGLTEAELAALDEAGALR